MLYICLYISTEKHDAEVVAISDSVSKLRDRAQVHNGGEPLTWRVTDVLAARGAYNNLYKIEEVEIEWKYNGK